jgi:hypothetical protein
MPRTKAAKKTKSFRQLMLKMKKKHTKQTHRKTYDGKMMMCGGGERYSGNQFRSVATDVYSGRAEAFETAKQRIIAAARHVAEQVNQS